MLKDEIENKIRLEKKQKKTNNNKKDEDQI